MTVLRRIAAHFAMASLMASQAFAMDVPVTASQIETFKGVSVGQQVDGLIWRGGIVLESQVSDFGGLSGITFTGTGTGNRLAMVSDVGDFASGNLIYDEAGRPLGLGGVVMTKIQNSKGDELPRKFAQDAESIETIYRDGIPTRVRVGFENLTRVADFDLINGRPDGPATEISVPKWVSDERTNESLESVCIAPPTSPVAGSTLLIMEGMRIGNGFTAHLLGNRDKGDLRLALHPGVNPTDCAFLPNGDLLVLERGVAILSFSMQLRRIPAEMVRAGETMDGPVILKASGGDIDNMEGLAVHPGPDGGSRITIISDDNFNDWERTLLLEFSLP